MRSTANKDEKSVIYQKQRLFSSCRIHTVNVIRMNRHSIQNRQAQNQRTLNGKDHDTNIRITSHSRAAVTLIVIFMTKEIIGKGKALPVAGRGDP
jgi:hypothetical protein